MAINRLNIIHDCRRTERYPPLMQELSRQRILDYKIWDAIVLPHSVVTSISESHKMIVRAAMEENLPYVIVAEDDIMFTADGAWGYYLRGMPAEFDLYLACTYIRPLNPLQINGFHLYTVAQKFYETFLNAPPNEHIDTAMNSLGGHYEICYPFAALQRAGWSANNNAYANYNSQTITAEDVFKGQPQKEPYY